MRQMMLNQVSLLCYTIQKNFVRLVFLSKIFYIILRQSSIYFQMFNGDY